MMSYVKWINKKAKSMKATDLSLLKLSVFFFTLFLVKVLPGLASLDWWWYLALGIVVAVPLWKKMFT